jgi:hypothetical protein
VQRERESVCVRVVCDCVYGLLVVRLLVVCEQPDCDEELECQQRGDVRDEGEEDGIVGGSHADVEIHTVMVEAVNASTVEVTMLSRPSLT